MCIPTVSGGSYWLSRHQTVRHPHCSGLSLGSIANLTYVRLCGPWERAQKKAWEQKHAQTLQAQKTVITYDKDLGVTAVKAQPGREGWSAKKVPGGRERLTPSKKKSKAMMQMDKDRKAGTKIKEKLGGRRLSSIALEEVRRETVHVKRA
jgi:hypothetical protein